MILRRLEEANRSACKIAELSDEVFEQFVEFLWNYRKHGYLHAMDFCRAEWGTKWIALNDWVGNTQVKFDTAWDCPLPIIKKLSTDNPDVLIGVEYADEDLGANCGHFQILNGEILNGQFHYRGQPVDADVLEEWRRFACKIWKRDYDEYFAES